MTRAPMHVGWIYDEQSCGLIEVVQHPPPPQTMEVVWVGGCYGYARVVGGAMEALFIVPWGCPGALFGPTGDGRAFRLATS